jgi:acyl-coenzyme A synthetase/AMP-(fatty) acid ligase
MHERIPRVIFISSIARRMPSADVARISHLQRVEAILNHHPAILESAIVAMSSELDEDDVKAVVVLKDNPKLSAEALWTFWR